MFPFKLEYVVLGNDPDSASAVASEVGGVAYVDDRADARSLPFRTLVRAVTDRPALLDPAASLGRYLVCVRPKKVRPEGADPASGVVQINAMVTNPGLTPDEADAHWRDVHAPLALKHHVGMSQYTQLSVVQVLDGPVYRGFALCEFDSMDDLRERFFDGPEGERVILADVATFADRDRSPRRLLARRVS
jgi:uncharacterized protein (TIGR02118 family)